MSTDQTIPSSLPVKRNLTLSYILSLVITVLMAAASIIGLVSRETVYPTDQLIEGIMPNDVINLVVGVPLFLVSMWLARRGKLIGLLLWTGAPLYVFYNYLAYILLVPLSLSYLLGLLLVTLCAYTLIVLVASIDADTVQRQLAGKVSERLSGGIAVAFGLLFAGRVIVMIVGALVSGTPIDSVELAVMVADFVISPAMVIGGVLLWQRRPLGYAAGLGLLFQASMLFIGLIAFLLIQPLLTDAPFNLTDILVVAVMGLVCFVPFGLFVRGVIGKGK